jgi:hypothetical protein
MLADAILLYLVLALVCFGAGYLLWALKSFLRVLAVLVWLVSLAFVVGAIRMTFSL